MPDQSFSGSFDFPGLQDTVSSHRAAFSSAWDDLLSIFQDVSLVDLSGYSTLPCFDTWHFPFGGQLTFCFSQFSDSLSYIGDGVFLVATLSALSIVFRS